jgi:hypothetical protein
MEWSEEEGVGGQGVSSSLDSSAGIIHHRPRKSPFMFRRMIANTSSH